MTVASRGGAWIETGRVGVLTGVAKSRPVGARGLKRGFIMMNQT
jgi:hypothetical protein